MQPRSATNASRSSISASRLARERSKRFSIGRTYKILGNKEKQREAKRLGSPSLPDGVYDMIYARGRIQ